MHVVQCAALILLHPTGLSGIQSPDVAKKQHDFIKTMQIRRKGCGM